MTEVRTRFAPSPTGELHLGNVRVAVFNWLFARRHGGSFVVRLEDTDVERNVPGAEERILDDLAWCGLHPDEGPGVGGPKGPYRQSERADDYRRAAASLEASGAAYRCYCSDEELARDTVTLEDGTEVRRYPGRCRDLSVGERERLEGEGVPWALRLATPRGPVTVEDVARGRVSFPEGDLDDFILLRRDGRPTYNFAVVVDDVEMAITHVIRGAGHLSNTHKQAVLFDAFGAARPVFAHLPTVLGPDRRKLSKREHGTSLGEFRRAGLHPDGVVNYLSLLGWSPGDDREVLGRDELVRLIDLDRLGATDTVYDPEKLRWFSGQHIARLPLGELVEAVRPWLPPGGELPVPPENLPWAVEALRSRLRALGELPGHLDELRPPGPEARRELAILQEEEGGAREVVAAVRQALSDVEPWDPETVGHAVRGAGKDVGARGKTLFVPLRLALTGRRKGPEMATLAAALGRVEVLRRLGQAIEWLGPEDPDSNGKERG